MILTSPCRLTVCRDDVAVSLNRRRRRRGKTGGFHGKLHDHIQQAKCLVMGDMLLRL